MGMDMENEQEFTKLADELEQENAGGRYTEVIRRLRNNWYHDFANPDEVPLPKVQMVQDFTDVGRQDIVERVKNGDFDQ